MTILQPVLQPVLRPLLADPLAPGFGDGLTAAVKALTDAIAAWNTSQSAVRVSYGGNERVWPHAGGVSGVAGTGRTFLAGTVNQGIRQHGYIRAISYECSVTGTPWKFKLLRPSGTAYSVVAETETFSPSSGVQTFIPVQPLGPCLPGDRIGLFISGSLGTIYATGSGLTYYLPGDLSSIDTESASAVSFDMNIQCFGTPPLLIGAGDSIMEGHNSASQWHSFLHTGPAGNPAAEILHGMRDLVPSLEYQNYGQGSTTWANVATRAPAIAAQKPRAVIVHCGINDVVAPRTWAAISADMDTFLAGLPAGTALFIKQVLPRSDGSDGNAAAIRALNANYETWCEANGAYLVRTHDAMGQIRSSTGLLDDLISAYNYDNTHLTVPAGVGALAQIMVLGAGSVSLS